MCGYPDETLSLVFDMLHNQCIIHVPVNDFILISLLLSVCVSFVILIWSTLGLINISILLEISICCRVEKLREWNKSSPCMGTLSWFNSSSWSGNIYIFVMSDTVGDIYPEANVSVPLFKFAVISNRDCSYEDINEYAGQNIFF